MIRDTIYYKWYCRKNNRSYIVKNFIEEDNSKSNIIFKKQNRNPLGDLSFCLYQDEKNNLAKFGFEFNRNNILENSFFHDYVTELCFDVPLNYNEIDSIEMIDIKWELERNNENNETKIM